MATPYEATIVQLSSGHITFNDPTKAWTPDDFPNLPSTSLGLTTRGRIEDGTFSTIRLTNAITYEAYEPSTVFSLLKKSFLIAENGDATFEETKMGFVSTVSAPFEAHVTHFTPSTIGGAQIYDVVSGNPDTVTTAIAKLDAWINNAFLQQPPAVQMSQVENTSLFAGVQWQNFNTYNVMDSFVPYVTSMVFLVGDPTSTDYLMFEVRNCKYFPYKTYKDGISPDGAPLVRLRLFSGDYGMQTGTAYKKSALSANGIHIISESGNLTLPALGPVLALNDTNGIDTYTTLSVFLPNLSSTYPLDSQIPVRIFYLNRTEGNVNTMSTLITQTMTGTPSVPQQLTPQSLYSNALQIEVERPVYSDSIGGATDPFFSTYQTSFTFKEMATAHAGNIGFQYGLPSPYTIPSSLSTFLTSYVQSDEYVLSTQSISTFIDTPPFYPGTIWTTSVTVINSAELVGDESTGVYASTLFGSQTAPNISSVNLVPTNPFVAPAYTLNYPVYTPGSGWSIGAPIDHAVVFLSSLTYLATSVSTSVQFNDPSFPGDRSTMTLKAYYIGTELNATPVLTDTLSLSTINDRFLLNTVQNSDLIATVIQDTESDVGYTDFFNKAQHTSLTLVSTTLGSNTQKAFLSFTNLINTGFNDPIMSQTYSTPNFVFETTSSLRYNTTNVVYTNTVTSTTAISGIYTPTSHSKIYIDLQGSNFTSNYVTSNFVCAEIMISTLGAVTPTICTNSKQRIFNTNTGSEITSLPFPVDTLLTFSSVQLTVNDWVYTDPIYVQPLRLLGQVTSSHPEDSVIVFESTFSTLFVDTYSSHTFQNFMSTTGIHGKRVLSLLPRLENPGTPMNMNDGITSNGDYGQGLNVAISSFIFMSTSEIAVSSFVNYSHTSSLSTFTTNPYSRELLYTSGRYIHPAGYNFSPFSGVPLGKPAAIYPDFTYDMYFDKTKGNRFASFMFEQPAFASPTPFQYMMIAIHNPNYISTITATRGNNFFPASPVVPYLMSSMRVHLHAKVIGEYCTGAMQNVETAWVNGFKQIDELTFDDSTYDVGGCSAVYVPSIGSNAGYMYSYIHFNRRFYTKIGAVVRLGISYDGSIYSGDPLTFDAVSISFSD